MAHDPALRREARRRYVIERESLPTIERTIGVKQSTLSRWKRDGAASGDDWALARKAQLLAGEGLEATVAEVTEQFALLAAKMMDRIKEIAKDDEVDPRQLVAMMTQLSDATTKMVRSAGRLAPRMSELGIAQDVLRRLITFVEREYPEHGAAVVEIVEPFGADLAKAYGG